MSHHQTRRYVERTSSIDISAVFYTLRLENNLTKLTSKNIYCVQIYLFSQVGVEEYCYKYLTFQMGRL